jgi:hypothetical protein
MKSVGVSDPGDPQPNRLVNFVSRVPAQMGWCKMKHKMRDEAYIILHRGARSRGYKLRERGFWPWGEPSELAPFFPLRVCLPWEGPGHPLL